MISIESQKLVNFFVAKNYKASFLQETNQVYLSLPIAQLKVELPLFIRVEREKDLLQLLVFVGQLDDPSHTAAVARLLHFLNKELDLPGFGMDETSRKLFFRAAIPCSKGMVDPLLLETFVNAMKVACEHFLQPITAIAKGMISFEELLQKIKEGSSLKTISE